MESKLRDIGVRIKAPRAGRGLTLTALSGELRARYGVKIDAGYLSKIENGKAEIPLRTLFAIADYFEISPTKLLEERERNGFVPDALEGPRDDGGNSTAEMDQVLGILNKPSFARDLRMLKEQVGETRALRYIQAALAHPAEEVRAEEA